MLWQVYRFHFFSLKGQLQRLLSTSQRNEKNPAPKERQGLSPAAEVLLGVACRCHDAGWFSADWLIFPINHVSWEFVRKMLIFVRGSKTSQIQSFSCFFSVEKNQVVKTVWKFLGGISQNDLCFSNRGWKMFPCFADDFPIICDDAHVVKGISSPC